MITYHQCFIQPVDGNIKLWRYMDLSKFLQLIQTKDIFFARASSFSDSFEGSTPSMNLAWRQHIMANRNTDPTLAGWRHLTDEQINGHFQGMTNFNFNLRNELFVSCWHMSEHESVAMWKVYSQSNESVCIQTTYNKLASALPYYTYMGMVSYIDYDKDVINEDNPYRRILHKRKQFEYEREVRAVAWQGLEAHLGGNEIRTRMNQFGLPVRVDMAFIENIYISPTAPYWLIDVVRSAAAAYGVYTQPMPSSLLRVPHSRQDTLLNAGAI